MRLRVQIIIEPDDSAPPVVEEVACIERTTLSPATLGLTLAEAKAVLGQIQETMTAQQVSSCIAQHEYCPHCQQLLARCCSELFDTLGVWKENRTPAM